MTKYALLLIGLSLIGLSSCKPDKPQIKFDKQQWAERSDMAYPYREQMLTDLLENQQVKSLTYSQLVELLGKPAGAELNNYEAWYEVVTDYGSDIDPIYVKSLVVQFDADSIVTSCQTQEWSKE